MQDHRELACNRDARACHAAAFGDLHAQARNADHLVLRISSERIEQTGGREVLAAPGEAWRSSLRSERGAAPATFSTDDAILLRRALCLGAMKNRPLHGES